MSVHAVSLTNCGGVVVNTAESVLGALDLEVRYRISFWDALVVQAAASSGAEILYSEDRVVNPLK